MNNRDIKIAAKALSIGAAVLAYVTLTHVSYYYDDLLTMNDNGLIMEDIEGCEPFPSLNPNPVIHTFGSRPQLTIEQQKLSLSIEEKHEDTISAARNANAAGVNPVRTLIDLITIESNEFARFTSEYSEIEFILHSNQPNAFKTEPNTTILDELIHIGFDEGVTYEHAVVQAAVDCARRRIIDEKEFAGEQINLFIASDPRTCWKNLIIQIKPKNLNPDEDFCDSVGGSYHKVSTGTIPFKPHYQKRWSAVLIATHDKEKAHQQVSEDIQHEVFGHLFFQMIGLPFKFDPNEGAADEIESSIRRSLYKYEVKLNGVKKNKYKYPEFISFQDKYFTDSSK